MKKWNPKAQSDLDKIHKALLSAQDSLTAYCAETSDVTSSPWVGLEQFEEALIAAQDAFNAWAYPKEVEAKRVVQFKVGDLIFDKSWKMQATIVSIDEDKKTAWIQRAPGWKGAVKLSSCSLVKKG